MKVEAEERHLLQQGVLVPEIQPIMSASVVPMVRNNEDIRLYGDYRMTTNKVIDSGSYHLPLFSKIVQELVSNLGWFSKIDLRQVYMQLPLDLQPQRLTTISIHFGHFNFIRLPFGFSMYFSALD